MVGELAAFKPAAMTGSAEEEVDNTAQVGRVLMTEYVIAFELAGVLLLVAMVGAIAISKKRVPSDEAVSETRPPG